MLSGKQRQLIQDIGDKLFEKVLHLDFSVTCNIAKNGALYYCVQFIASHIIFYQENLNLGWLRPWFHLEMWYKMHVSISIFL